MNLIESTIECCGCGSCVDLCPKQAINLIEDQYGFLYPLINQELCIDCGKCRSNCAFQKAHDGNEPIKVFAALLKDNEKLKLSASGGLFYCLAKKILGMNGVVYGSAMKYYDGKLNVEHIRVDKIEDLGLIQGSKYVQSKTVNILRYVMDDVKSGKNVLFSGTPCQVDGLRSLLRYKEYPNLYTVDIICHGVPNLKLFQAYIANEERKYNGSIVNYTFRDKTIGWGLYGRIDYIKNGKKKTKYINPNLSSYYRLFLNSEIYRDSCYRCKYTTKKRTGDITLGDYWGIEKMHPEFLMENGGKFNLKLGVSCVLLNTEKAMELFSKIEDDLIFETSTFENISKGNEQLKHPSRHTDARNQILDLYVKNGYSSVDDWYYKSLGLKKYQIRIWGMIPNSVKTIIKRIMHK